MTTTIFEIREGTTEPITVTLYDGTTAANITGYSSVALFLRAEDGTTISKTDGVGGGITVTTAASGLLAVSFGETDLLYSKRNYSGYIIVEDGTGKRSAFPSDSEFIFNVRERFSNDT